MENAIELLSELLSCGYADAEYLLKEFENFRVSVSEAVERVRDNEQPMIFDSILSNVYELAVENAKVNTDLYEYEIYLNYMDSHLYIIEKHDGGTITEEIYSFEDLLPYAIVDEESLDSAEEK